MSELITVKRSLKIALTLMTREQREQFINMMCKGCYYNDGEKHFQCLKCNYGDEFERS